MCSHALSVIPNDASPLFLLWNGSDDGVAGLAGSGEVARVASAATGIGSVCVPTVFRLLHVYAWSKRTQCGVPQYRQCVPAEPWHFWCSYLKTEVYCISDVSGRIISRKPCILTGTAWLMVVRTAVRNFWRDALVSIMFASSWQCSIFVLMWICSFVAVIAFVFDRSLRAVSLLSLTGL